MIRLCYSHSVVTLIFSCLISIIYHLSKVSVQLMCNLPFTLHVFLTLVQLLQLNSLRNRLLHIVRRRTCLIHTRSSVRSFTCSFVSLVCKNELAVQSVHLIHQALWHHALYAAHPPLRLHLLVR